MHDTELKEKEFGSCIICDIYHGASPFSIEKLPRPPVMSGALLFGGILL
jgi:hypothetical protein